MSTAVYELVQLQGDLQPLKYQLTGLAVHQDILYVGAADGTMRMLKPVGGASVPPVFAVFAHVCDAVFARGLTLLSVDVYVRVCVLTSVYVYHCVCMHASLFVRVFPDDLDDPQYKVVTIISKFARSRKPVTQLKVRR